MRITKKILAGTLALMSAFTAVSAEPVKSEKPSAVSKNVNNEKWKREFIEKKLIKYNTIAAGTLFAVAGLLGIVKLFSKDDKNYASEDIKDDDSKEDRIVNDCEIVNNCESTIFGYYFASNIRKFIKDFTSKEEAEIKLKESFICLFEFLDGVVTIDSWSLNSYINQIQLAPQDRGLIKAIDLLVEKYVYSGNFDNIHDIANDKLNFVNPIKDEMIFRLNLKKDNCNPRPRSYRECIHSFKNSGEIYDLTAIIGFKADTSFVDILSCKKYGEKDWRRCSFDDDNGGKISEGEIDSIFQSDGNFDIHYIDFIYTKRSE